MSQPPIEMEQFNQHIPGFYGEFGTGGNTQIFFVQCGIRPADLKKVTLIGEIPGSESWSVRDLFQRDVDVGRVTNSLLPYLHDNTKVKFFNPLTLTLLPIDSANHQIITEIPSLEIREQQEKDTKWIYHEVADYYRFRHLSGHPEWAYVDWNDANTRIVAIDGQHRLSALKRYFDDASNSSIGEDFFKWTIPVVIFGLKALDVNAPSMTLLDVIRNIFIYINTQAKPPNDARQILLTDESINAICAQELLEYAHENDVLEVRERSSEKVPLLFFDWRGEEEEGKRRWSPAALKLIEEINNWFQYYLLGEDFSTQQKIAFCVTPVHRLQEAFVRKGLRPRDARAVREIFAKEMRPGIAFFLEHFEPYRKYISEIRELERKMNEESDIAKFAFYQLRFGSNRGGEDIQDEIRLVYEEIVHDILDIKAGIPKILDLDIGMRGLMYAFGQILSYQREFQDSDVSWFDYARWFTECANSANSMDWFGLNRKRQRDLLLHISHDQNDGVVNYRLHQVGDALGAFYVIIVAAFGTSIGQFPTRDILDQIIEIESEKLYSTVLRGYKKEHRVLLKEDFPDGGRPLTDAVNAAARRSSAAHIRRVNKVVGGIVDS